MDPTDQGPSPAQVALEEAYISATLNSTMLYILLQGLYTITYIGAAYLYSTRNTTRKKYVLYFMHALFALGMSQMTIQWYFLKYIFVDKGDTRETIFAASTIIKPSIQVGTIVIQYMQFILANAFLVWRCYYMENYSLRAVSPMLALLAGEVGTHNTGIPLSFIHTLTLDL
ncbi:hypothetical protein CPC08DRAFT_380654 [Agrocybe pediades]|nr:hypothetical protein CPC08DRAFT_380654 [Agrocybe pediades]